MQLSPEREASLINEAMPKIYHAVDCYTAKCARNSGVVSYDDLVQNVTEAYLRYIRRCETEEALQIFPWYDATHAMCDAVLTGLPFSVPKTTKKFTEVLRSLPHTVSLDLLVTKGLDIDGMSKSWVQDKETEIDFDIFMESQDMLSNRIVAMRLRDMPLRKIAGHCVVPKSSVFDRIKKINQEYQKFIEEDDSDA